MTVVARGSPAALALGYTGGGILSLCLIPQIARIVKTRSTRDIAMSWALLYLVGLLLTLTYLIIEDAIAAYIPLTVEIAGSVTIIALKLLYERHPKFSTAAAASSAMAASTAATGQQREQQSQQSQMALAGGLGKVMAATAGAGAGADEASGPPAFASSAGESSMSDVRLLVSVPGGTSSMSGGGGGAPIVHHRRPTTPRGSA